MRSATGRVAEIFSGSGGTQARIVCPAWAVPAPGQFTLAARPGDALGTPLFYSGSAQDGFLAAAPVPAGWNPGDSLALRGPGGRGFRLPANPVRLALLAAGGTVSRLYPLALPALAQGAAVTFFSDIPVGGLPAAVEAYPLSEFAGLAAWPNFLAVDLALESLPRLGPLLGLAAGERPACPGQVLVFTEMPCAGLAECGVCGVETRHGWKLACVQGPVFDLDELLA